MLEKHDCLYYVHVRGHTRADGLQHGEEKGAQLRGCL
jgi:hypothetical protein